MHQNTNTSLPNQEILTSQLSNPTHWMKPPQQKGTTDHQNTESPLQTQQYKQEWKAEKYPKVKEHEKCPPSQTKEEEIWNLPDKEFPIMIVKMIQNLENKTELQTNSLETRTEKMQEMFNKDLEEIKKSIKNE